MRKLSKIIIEDGANDFNENSWVRKTARGIFIKDDKVLMVYSSGFDDYTFPGGGVKKSETYQKALYRELAEEVGAFGIKIIKAFGQTLEVRKSVRFTGESYRQISKYFIVSAIGFGEQDLEQREANHGVDPIWIKPEEALVHNEKVMLNEMHQQVGAKTTILRDNIILKTLIKEGLK